MSDLVSLEITSHQGMNRIAVFPGSFDPFTRGHEEIVKRALEIFDRLIIAIGENAEKKYLFSQVQRLTLIKDVFHLEQRVSIESYPGLTVEFCKKVGAGFIVRGIRNPGDFQFESDIAALNKQMDGKIETVFLSASPGLAHLSSTLVRDIYKNGGNITELIPEGMVIPAR